MGVSVPNEGRRKPLPKGDTEREGLQIFDVTSNEQQILFSAFRIFHGECVVFCEQKTAGVRESFAQTSSVVKTR
jgi:hypothetical protein